MDSMDDNAWVFDSLVGFLHGPIWNIPLQTFIEEKSLPFEPTDNGEVLDRPEYKKIHVEYRNLVDVMLGSFMDDIGISAEQFEAACKLSARDLAGLPTHFHRRLFEQIWAANDYDMFVKMMTHKNVELQLQALELIETRYGMMPNIFLSEPGDLDSSRSEESVEWPDNDDVMTEIKKLQLEELEEKDEVVSVPPEDVVAEKQTLLSKLHSFDKKERDVQPIKLLPESTPVKKVSNIEQPPKKIETFRPGYIGQDTANVVCRNIPSDNDQVSDEEILARQKYLKEQRDKLLALKKQVRTRRLGAVDGGPEFEAAGENSQKNVPRPRSARMAQAAMAGAAPTPPPDAMQLRKALAFKLKTEVVDN